MQVKITVTPVKGKPRTEDVEVSEGATVEEALKKAGVGVKGFNFTLNGEPAKADTKIDASVILKANEVVQVGATEKVAGS